MENRHLSETLELHGREYNILVHLKLWQPIFHGFNHPCAFHPVRMVLQNYRHLAIVVAVVEVDRNHKLEALWSKQRSQLY